MLKLSSYEFVVYQLMSLVFGMDKASWADRLAAYKAKVTPEACIEAINVMKDQGERALARMAYHQWLDAKAGLPFDIDILLDRCSSGACDISLELRCLTGLKSVGAVNDSKVPVEEQKPGNLYQLMVDEFNKRNGTHYTKNEFKEAVIPFYYCGDKDVSRLFNGDLKLIQSFHDVYKKFLPKAYAFRQACIDAWEPCWTKLCWTLPDGYQVMIPVTDLEEGEAQWYCNHKKYSKKFKLPVIKGLEKGRNKTRSIAANIVHSLDAWELRELSMMCYMDKNSALASVQRCVGGTVPMNPTLQRLYKMYQLFGIASARALVVLGKTDKCYDIPADFLSALEEVALHLPKKGFKIRHIHDEFGCLPKYCNDMRKCINWIDAQMYRSNFGEYITKKFGLKVEVGEFDEEVYNSLLDSSFLLS